MRLEMLSGTVLESLRTELTSSNTDSVKSLHLFLGIDCVQQRRKPVRCCSQRQERNTYSFLCPPRQKILKEFSGIRISPCKPMLTTYKLKTHNQHFVTILQFAAELRFWEIVSRVCCVARIKISSDVSAGALTDFETLCCTSSR